MKKVIWRIWMILLTLLPTQMEAKIWLPSVLSDGMVLQQRSEVTIWGWTSEANETITVLGSWNNEEINVKANIGHWSVKLPTPKAGGPYTVTVKGHETLILKDILIGEVWICSGQSNMQWTPNQGLDNKEAEVAAADFPKIRFFQVPRRWSDYRQEDVPGQWAACSPETMQNFSSVAYFFGRELHQKLDVPIGLISSNWGGTPVETWIPEKVLKAHPDLSEASKKIQPNPWWPSEVGKAYNGMIHPFVNFSLAGTIWYQGESNRVNAQSYYQSFPLLIKTWRRLWQDDFPFYFVQLAPYKYDDPNQREVAMVRDAQWNTLKTVKHTGMAVTMDIGNVENIHPTNKQDVGKRLALWALAKSYDKNVVYSGPIFKSMEIKGRKALVHFDTMGGSLVSKNGIPTHFEIAGEDQKFHLAKTRIKQNVVEVSSKAVKRPVAVRYAFTNGAQPNLFNAEGLPALPFRTDNWPLMEE